MWFGAPRLRRLGVAGLTLTVAGAVLTTGPLAARAHAATDTPTLSAYDARLLYDVNHSRAAHGLHPLVLAAGTTDVAHGWSCRLAGSAVLEHNPNLGVAVEHHGSRSWTAYGENAGVAASTSGADALFRAYMSSPEHRANILDTQYRYVGVWSKLLARRGGTRSTLSVSRPAPTTTPTARPARPADLTGAAS